MTSPTEDALAEVKLVESCLEKINQAGHLVVQAKLPQFEDRDWESEAYLDRWVGLYARNIAEHYKEIVAGQTIARIQGVFHNNFPAAVVGAGPSLDKNAGYLRDFPGLIVSTDRAAKCLVSRGIQPDLVVSVDPHVHVIADMLDYSGNSNHVLVLSVCCDPKIASVWKGTLLYMSQLNPGTQFFDRILPELFPTMPGLYTLGNVGNMAVQLAHWVGCSPIVLVGQDYAYTGGKMHADSWEHANGRWQRVQEDHAAKLERRTGKVLVGDTWTYSPYLSYKQTLYRIKDTFKLDLLNATEGGILTELKQVKLKDIAKQLRRPKRAELEARTLFAQAAGGTNGSSSSQHAAGPGQAVLQANDRCR